MLKYVLKYEIGTQKFQENLKLINEDFQKEIMKIREINSTWDLEVKPQHLQTFSN